MKGKLRQDILNCRDRTPSYLIVRLLFSTEYPVFKSIVIFLNYIVMYSLLLSTLAMMALTFIIGFFVAGIIKTIANWADFLDFYHSHKEEILNLREKRKVSQLTPATELTLVTSRKHTGRQRKLGQRLNETIHHLKPQRKVTA